MLSGSRLSRLYANLVQQDKAYTAVAIPGWPGKKHASALLVSAVPAAGTSLEQLDAAIHRELNDLAASGPTANELARIKKVISPYPTTLITTKVCIADTKKCLLLHRQLQSAM